MEAETLVILSSSPDFPSIEELLPKRDKKPPLRSGSRAAPIPETALKSFMTASHFWQSTIAKGKESVEDAETPAGDKEKDHPINKQASSDAVDVTGNGIAAETLPEAATTDPPAPAVPAKKPRAPRRPKAKAVEANPVFVEIPDGLELSPKEKPWKKYKEKDPTDGQTKIAQGKVTKPSIVKPKQPRKKAETVSKHFAPAANPAPLEIDDDPIDLEPAMKRRTDWTPTKNTDQPVIILDSSTVTDAVSPRPSAAESTFHPRQDIFKSLRDTYSCSDVEEPDRAATPLGEPADILGKRKLIEMVTTTKPAEEKTPEVSPVKQKAPKKKPRTITELATAAYRVIDIVEEAHQPQEDSVLNYFTTTEKPKPETADGDKDEDAASKAVKGPKPGAKPKAKPKRASKKKAEPPQPILLSPESAMRQVSRQDFVFGTSSQLATEADAGLLRDMQRAMRESNRWNEDNPFLSSPINVNMATKSTGNRLWRAGARDEEGDLLEVEVIDLVDSPAIEKDLTNPDVILSLAAGAAIADPKNSLDLPPVDATIISISSSLTPTQAAPRLSFTQKRPTSSAPAATVSTPLHLSLTQPVDLEEDPPASNQEQYHQMTSSMPEPSAPAPPEIPAPKYELYTDAQLAGAIQSYGFKPIKKRTAAIALLHQCWESKNRSRGQALGQGSTASLSTSSAAAAKAKPSASAPAASKPRGRPKKSASVAEPSESASASAPAPAPEPAKRPRGRPKKDAASGEPSAPKKTIRSTTTKKRPSLSPPPAATSEHTPGPSTPKRRRKASVQPAPIEIADSDESDLDDPFATSSAASSAASSPGPANEFSSPVAGVDLSMTEVDESVLSLTSSPTNQQTRLFKYITDAVRTAPRSTDPLNPSWHEKMLLYDPVVLEDLTAWLNAGQLDRVGCEEEVGCQDVKKWCESKSICCLWKVNINGKERKRF